MQNTPRFSEEVTSGELADKAFLVAYEKLKFNYFKRAPRGGTAGYGICLVSY